MPFSTSCQLTLVGCCWFLVPGSLLLVHGSWFLVSCLHAFTSLRLYAFTPLHLYTFTPLRLYAFTPIIYTSSAKTSAFVCFVFSSAIDLVFPIKGFSCLIVHREGRIQIIMNSIPWFGCL
jgi:hypothetical protein